MAAAGGGRTPQFENTPSRNGEHCSASLGKSLFFVPSNARRSDLAGISDQGWLGCLAWAGIHDGSANLQVAPSAAIADKVGQASRLPCFGVARGRATDVTQS